MSALDGGLYNISHLFGNESPSSTSTSAIPTPQITRRQILLHLKNCSFQLTKFVHSNNLLDISLQPVQDLCTAIELCLIYGMKINEFNGKIPLWFLLEKLESLSPPCIPLRNTIGAVASMHTLRTSIGKSRGWIRQILNTKGGLDEALTVIVNNQNLLRSFYYPHSVLTDKDDSLILVSLLDSIFLIFFEYYMQILFRLPLFVL